MASELLTPGQLLKKYPNTDFTTSDIGRLLRLNILDGRQTKRESLVSEESFKNLIEYMNKIIDSKKINLYSKC